MNRNIIKNVLGVDDFVLDMISSEADRLKYLSLPARHPFFFHSVLAIISNIVFPLLGLKRKVQSANDDFVFISCPDTAFRTKTIGMISEGLRYSIIYLPNFHVPTALRYHKFFNKEGIKVFFPTIKLWQVLAARRLYKEIIKSMDEKDDTFEMQKLKSVLCSYIIYDYVAKDYIDRLESFKGKWILEHQKFYFLASVANLHTKGIESTMLQHGIFFQPVYDFIPLLCDKVLCCSERERKLYLENGIDANRIQVFGAPLQTLLQTNMTITKRNHYDLLILMTIVCDDNVELLRQVLEYVKTHFCHVLVRMRPRSRKKDEVLLADTLKGMTLSSVGSHINDDIMSCDKVVSLSIDANVEVIKYHKPFVYIWDGKDCDNINQLNCATKDNFKEEIRKLGDSEFYSSFSEDQYKEILGETDLVKLKDMFVSYVRFNRTK